MKLYIIAAFLFVALTAVSAAPIEEGAPKESEEFHDIDIRSVSDVHTRDKRATCAIPGKIGDWVGDSVCFGHCLWLGHIYGGHCKGGICHCD